MLKSSTAHRRALLSGVSAAVGLGMSLAATSAHAIVVNNNQNRNAPPTLDTAAGVNGVGQMLIPARNAAGVATGGFGLCTGTLINPRTVIFAAHCVNGAGSGGITPASSYGFNTGGTPIAFGFRADNLASNGRPFDNAAQNYAFGFQTGPTVNNRGPAFQTRVADSLYNANQVFYDPRSTLTSNRLGDPTQGRNFLEADIALATLDTPARGVPTWTLLFSPLTASTHITITGYGLSGTGTTGSSQAIDFRRRAAENILNALISLDDEARAVFNQTRPNPQDLYLFDFDDPARGTVGANRFDFDIYRDAALPREGTTAGGDSGGPLIVDQRFSQPVVAGVLSGGGGFSALQPGSSYGERSFYQPLFLFWDVIVANNPYRYVTANAGDRDWFDTTGWTQQMDPAYAVIENGQLRNGLPTTPALGVSGATPGFGNVCNGPDLTCTNFNPIGGVAPGSADEAPVAGEAEVSQSEPPRTEPVNYTDDATLDSSGLSTRGPAFASVGSPFTDGEAAATGEAAEVSPAKADPSEASGSLESGTAPEGPTEQSRAALPGPGEAAPAPPPATTPGLRIPGGPGSTGFAPNNQDGNRLTGQRANYYDVTLSNAGTVTLGANANAALRTATVDRLAISNNAARLNITSGGNLTSLMDTTLFSGSLNVDGRLSTPEFLLMAGSLSGSGNIRTDFLTSIMGVIAPGPNGGIGQVGTLTVEGNLILTSGTQLVIDLASRPTTFAPPAVGPTSNDLLRTVAGGSERGNIVVGGLLSLNLLPGFSPTFGDIYTIVSATAPAAGALPAATVTGRFSAVNDFVGVLRPELIYTANTVQLRVAAASFLTLTDPNAGIQTNFGRILDTARTDPAARAALGDLFAQLDVLEGAALRSSLESLAPYSTVTTSNLVRSHIESFNQLIGARTHAARESHGGMMVMGSPVAALGMQDPMSMPDGTAMNDAAQPMTMDMAEGFTGFIAGGFINADAQPLSNTVFGGEEELESLYVATGVERKLFDRAVVGGAVAYSNGQAEYQGDLNRVQVDQIQIAGYGGYEHPSGAFVDAHGTLGWFKAESSRQPRVGTQVFSVRDENYGGTGSLGLAAGYNVRHSMVTVTPLASIDYNALRTNSTMESGGGTIGGTVTSTSAAAGLTIRSRTVEEAIARLAVKVAADVNAGGLRLRPHLKLGVAGDVLENKEDPVVATLTGAPNSLVSFAAAARDDFWYEAAVGVTVQGERFNLNVGYSGDIDRVDLEAHRFNASLSYRF